ncbi:glycerophosphoryl diester phosphodiesterase membrane domain-containing protein [Paenibacillus sp. OV219]|uniref:glycerophosphoryl diester phosphodiesterase membrane domain-containing protein n=1 Tax=Paenibacillus sp. OV219 TaxID=1884377 RepID=UPI0008D1D1BB|nr:glycerophosphoryl diester phosphodiesterase membrane domain-containing protein [Paenibacillus sp. OV219]SEP00719.1 Membrane domain of glycerophosphoryl diester phosphodiesterase [Paenibacillus sp. OV219]
MSNVLHKPMGIGRMLDYSFQLYRRQFGKLFLLTLLYFGPIYLLMYLLMPTAMEQSATNFSVIFDTFSGSTVDPVLQQDTLDAGAVTSLVGIVLFILIAIVYLVCLGPVFAAASVFFVQSIFDGHAPLSIREALKQAFRRFGALLGSSLLFALICFGLTVVSVILLVILFAVGAGGMFIGGSFSEGGSAATSVISVIVMIVVVYLGLILLWSYFAIRWMYYLPVTALKEESIGLGRSWTLTRKSFWRLFGTMFIMSLIVWVVTVVVQLLLTALIGPSMLGELLSVLIKIVCIPLPIVLYAVSFFDLKVRKEGYGLDHMISQMTNIEPKQDPDLKDE